MAHFLSQFCFILAAIVVGLAICCGLFYSGGERREATPTPARKASAEKSIPDDSPADYPRLPAVSRNKSARVWSSEEIKAYDGSDPDRPLLLTIVGEVYDVGTGARFYSPGKGYAGFAGRDASRGFGSGLGEDEALSSKVLDLDPEELQGILGWRTFYRNHETYRFVGFLEGFYFDKHGDQTEDLKRVDALHEDQGKLDKLKEELRKRFLGCNSKNENAKANFEIWCDDGYHGKRSRPVHVYIKLPSADKKEEGWCACLTSKNRKAAEAEAAEMVTRPQPGKATFRLASYPECEKGAQRCNRPKGAGSP